MRVATLGWDYEKATATIELGATDDEDVTEGYRMVHCALRDKPWLEAGEKDGPEAMLQFLQDCFVRMGYEVSHVGDVETKCTKVLH